MSLAVSPVCFASNESNLAGGAAPFGTTVTAGTPAHTKNATYTQLIASTSFDAYAILILFGDVTTSAARTSLLVDIAIGAAASETVIIPNLNAGYGQTTNINVGSQKYFFPLYIPAGSRLSATAQSFVVSDTVSVSVWLLGEPSLPIWTGSQVVTYGANTATSGGVAVTPGGSGAEGSWTEITSATSQDHYFLSAGVGLNASTAVSNSVAYLDLGVGAATEQAVSENWPFAATTAEILYQAMPVLAWTEVASGSRLVARMSGSPAVGTPHDVIFYGVS